MIYKRKNRSLKRS